MDFGSEIKSFLDGAAGNWTAYVGALTIIGGVTMAIIQTAKDLLPLRQWFQRRALKKWMRIGQSESGAVLGRDASADVAEAQLLKLAVDGDAGALYDLQIEQLCGQFTAAIQVVLQFPSRYSDLLAVTASQASADDIKTILQPPPSPVTSDFVDARTRVTQQCQRAIDAFQIDTGFRWKWILQIASFAISAILAAMALTNPKQHIALNPISVAFSALLAGFLAPVGKDLLAVLQKARGQ